MIFIELLSHLMFLCHPYIVSITHKFSIEELLGFKNSVVYDLQFGKVPDPELPGHLLLEQNQVWRWIQIKFILETIFALTVMQPLKIFYYINPDIF